MRRILYYRSLRKSIANIQVDGPTVDFADLKNVGLSGWVSLLITLIIFLYRAVRAVMKGMVHT